MKARAYLGTAISMLSILITVIFFSNELMPDLLRGIFGTFFTIVVIILIIINAILGDD